MRSERAGGDSTPALGNKYMADRLQLELSNLHLQLLNQRMPSGFLLEQLEPPANHQVTAYFRDAPRQKHLKWCKASSRQYLKNDM